MNSKKTMINIFSPQTSQTSNMSISTSLSTSMATTDDNNSVTSITQNPNPLIILESADNTKEKCTKYAVSQSKLISELLNNMEEINPELFSQDVTIPVCKISGEMLHQIMNWCERRPNKPQSDPTNKNEYLRDHHDVSSFKSIYTQNLFDSLMRQNMFYAFLAGVHYLEITELYNLMLKYLGGLMDRKNAYQIRTFFGIKDDGEGDELSFEEM